MLKSFMTLILLSISVYGSDFEVNAPINLLFFGAFGMIIIYNMSYYFMVKNKVYADYSLFHIFVFIIMLFYTETFDAKLLEYSIHNIPVGMFIFATMALLSFTNNFLDLKKLHKNLDKYIKYIQITLLGLFALSVIKITNTLVLNIAIGFVLLIVLSMLTIAVYKVKITRDTNSPYYLLGFSGILVSIIISLLSYFNMMDLNINMVYLIEFALLFEASVFSFAIAHKHQVTTLKLKQNDLLFKELSHRVQNNLQSIISIITLQMNRTKELSLKEVLQNTINRIRSISLIHEKLQNSNVIGEVDIKTYFQGLIEPYKTLHKEIEFNLTCDENTYIDIEKLTALSLITNELVTNSIKHAFSNAENPKIRLEITKGKSYTFVYEDNGVGHNNTKESIGSLLIKNLSTNQLKGKYTINSQNRYLFSLEF